MFLVLGALFHLIFSSTVHHNYKILGAKLKIIRVIETEMFDF